MEHTIVLKNIRRDIPAMKPLAAKVIQLQRQLIEAVQRYQELNSKPDQDEALLQKLLDDIARINQSQREELALVREAENLYSYNSPQPEEINGVNDDKAISSQYIADSEESLATSLNKDEEEIPEEEPEEFVMDWEDLTREHWSETDKLLHKIERLGSRVPQLDFMSSVELVHVTKYKEAEEAMTKRKLRMIDGKPVITTGPWQMIDIPTKVSNRRCNYLTGLHVTVRPKDLNATKKPLSSGPAIHEGGVGGIKTRNNNNGDSRGSSRNSSRASSPVSSLTDHRLYRNGHQPSNFKLSRSIKTRASKLKRAVAPATTSNHTKIVAPASIKPSTPVSVATAPKIPITPAGATTTTTTENKPFVTYTVVDGIPHFRVIFPSRNSNSNGNINQSKTSTPTSIVESVVRSGSASSSSSAASSSSGRENGHQPPRNSVKPILKRPRLAQGLSPTKTVTNGSPSSAPLDTLASSSSSTNSKEELGRCIEKCGSWMGAPHFKTYRTFPPVNASGLAAEGSLTSPPAPKLSSPKTALPACIKSSAMPPKLIMGGNNHHNSNTGNKFVSIAPKSTLVAPMNGVKPRPPVSLLKTCPLLFGGKNLMKEFQQNKFIKIGPKTGQHQSMGMASGQEDLKKKTTVTKVVKLLPSGNEQLQSGAEEAPHFSPPPTVIVADMSA